MHRAAQAPAQKPGSARLTVPSSGNSTLRSPVQLAMVGDSSRKLAAPLNGAGGSTVAAVGVPLGEVSEKLPLPSPPMALVVATTSSLPCRWV